MGLVAWMLIVMMMGAGIGRTSNTLELRGARRILVLVCFGLAWFWLRTSIEVHMKSSGYSCFLFVVEVWVCFGLVWICLRSGLEVPINYVLICVLWSGFGFALGWLVATRYQPGAE